MGFFYVFIKIMTYGRWKSFKKWLNFFWAWLYFFLFNLLIITDTLFIFFLPIYVFYKKNCYNRQRYIFLEISLFQCVDNNTNSVLLSAHCKRLGGVPVFGTFFLAFSVKWLLTEYFFWLKICISKKDVRCYH